MSLDKIAKIAPLPESVRVLLNRNTHPGLALDKYAESFLWSEARTDGDKKSHDGGEKEGKWQEEIQRKTCDKVVELSRLAPEGINFDGLFSRREGYLKALGAKRLEAEVSGPLTLHLSRASALENAGICLHPLYGFVYIPGSGLKGMARAYAETVWLKAQENKAGAWQNIEKVFGWAPASDKDKPWKPADVPKQKGDKASAGAVVFHDAWPTSWPRLLVDIVNCHHRKYYEGGDAPGDWDDPSPVYFLAVGPGQRFSFAISKRRGDVSDDLLRLALEWLIGALTHEGAGAKTAAGYGAFRLVEEGEGARRSLEAAQETWESAKGAKARAEFQTTLELVTPAFLAGASQQAEDCDLRPATLRGILRGWWRTMHAGWVNDAKTLRAMEAAVWGDTSAGGAVRVTVERCGNWQPELYDKSAKVRMTDEQKRSEHGIPGCNPRQTTQGLWYASYGMDEFSKRAGERKQRYFAPPGAKWTVCFTARDSFYLRPDAKDDEKPVRIKALSAESSGRPGGDAKDDEKPVRIESELLLEQAKAALWLLCHFGGVGSKSRKGFGSLAASFESSLDLDKCKDDASRFRSECGIVSQQKGDPESPALENMITLPPDEASSSTEAEPAVADFPERKNSPPSDVTTPWTNAWFVMEQIGDVAQSFAQDKPETGHGKHCEQKVALGLPRQIHGPRDRPLEYQKKNWRPPKKLSSKRGDRWASPVFYHVAKDASTGQLSVRVVAFPTRDLPSLDTSRKVLKELLKHIKERFEDKVKRLKDKGRAPMTPPASPQYAGETTAQIARLPKPGDRVEAVLLEEKTKKGGWKAKYEPSGLVGPIQNSSNVPSDKKPGDRVALIVASVGTTGDIQFRWPTAADEERMKKGPKHGKDRPGGDRRGSPGHGRR